MKLLSNLRSEIQQLTRDQRWFTFFCMISGFLIAAEYGITRPASQALFLTLFSAKAFPWVWLATVPLNLSAIYCYSRFLPKIGPLPMFVSLAFVTVVINASTSFLLPIFPSWIFFQFAWKDIYILLMFKQLWSMIHSTIPSSKAKYLYGIIFGTGTFGSILASFIPGYFAVSLGSEKLYLFTIPLYLCLILSYRSAFERSLIPKEGFGANLTPNPSAKEGISLIRKNRFLGMILLLVVLMQVSVGLMEYQFNSHLELHILQKDLRTAYCGALMGWTNLLSGFFQLFGSFLMVHRFGLKGSHLIVPLMLLLSGGVSFFIPSFALLSFSYVFLKAVDFSLFGVIREMLYIPLKLDEKFRAKAIIDVFAYRTSKALLSGCILLIQLVAGSYFLHLAPILSLGIFILWIGAVYFTFKGQELLATR